LGGMLFILVHLRAFCPIIVVHPTCVFVLLAMIGPTLDAILTFMIAKRVFNIWVFSVINKVCSLIFTWIGPFYIIFSWFFYS
jgi:hypothetical protein